MSDAFAPPSSSLSSVDCKPVKGQAGALSVLLIIWLVMAVFILLTEVAAVVSGNLVNNDLFILGQAGIYLLQLVVLLACAVTWCMWSSRVAMNLQKMGVEGQQYTPGWVVGSWFVPILNLFRPYQITKELFVLSDPNDEMAPAPGYLGMWWGAWIITGIVGQISFRMMMNGAEEASLMLDPVSSITGIVAGALAFLIVRDLTARHSELLDVHS